MECEFCNKVFSTKGTLKTHQTKSKYCLKLQNSTPETIYTCTICSKTFILKSSYDRHETTCKNKPNNLNNKIEELKKTLLEEKEDTLKKALEEIEELKNKLKISQEELKITQTQLKIFQEENLKYLQEQNTDNKKKIDSMTKKYVKKQPRVKYEISNVIYIVTTALLKKERRYILGKAGDLTFRLSTYNKTDEHEVVYYQGCGDEDTMTIVETVVFQRLKEYRERANRERFILPEDKEIDIFIDAIKKSIEFIIEK